MTSTPRPKSKPRDRIIAAGSRLLLGGGIHTVSVDRLSQEALVSKRSLYQYFESKYDVLEAALEVSGPQILAMYLPADGESREPLEEILAVFDAIQRLSRSDDFAGCPFVNVSTALRDSANPSSRQALRYKQELTAFFERQARRLDAAEPESLAIQLTMLFDGACAYAATRGIPTPDSARGAAESLCMNAPKVTHFS